MALVKTRKQSLINDDDQATIEHYFGQLTGEVEPDIDIIRPKAIELARLLGAVRNAIGSFASVIHKFDAYAHQAEEIDAFVTALDATVAQLRVPDDQLAATWASIKSSECVCILIKSCERLVEIRAGLVSSNAPTDSGFMARYSGLTYEPFAFCSLDIKHLWMIDGDESPDLRELIYVVLRQMAELTHLIFSLVTSPDADIKSISTIVVKALAGLKKHLPRCDLAFRQIEASVSMLETNFDDYFRDYVESQNNKHGIFIRFLGDVAKSAGGNNPVLIMQLRQIVNFYQKNAQDQVKTGKATPAQYAHFDTIVKSYMSVEKYALNSSGAPAPIEQAPAPPNETTPASASPDDRDLDDLMRAINDTRLTSVKPNASKGARRV